MRAVILTADQFEDVEVFFPFFQVNRRGHKGGHRGTSKEIIHGEHRYGLKPDKKIDQTNPDDYDLLIILGGTPRGAPTTVRKHPKAVEITKIFFAENKPVASIYQGPYTLV